MIGSNSSLAEDPLTKCNLNPLHSLRRSTRTMSRNIARNPPPRQLTIKETLETLTHWETTFKIYYKRDEIYRAFFKADFKWNPNEECFGLQDETAGSNPQMKAELCEDLKDLLNTFSGYLPHSYLTGKILKSSSWKSVWRIVHDHYNVQVSSETMLDFETLKKMEDETYRQFFERLLQHTQQHLAPAQAQVDDIKLISEDKMTISLTNLVALQWLRKINPELINIVKTEYGKDLRNNIQLATLVHQIAPNIDSLLARYDHGMAVHKTIEYENNVQNIESKINKTFVGSRNRRMASNTFKNEDNSKRNLNKRG